MHFFPKIMSTQNMEQQGHGLPEGWDLQGNRQGCRGGPSHHPSQQSGLEASRSVPALDIGQIHGYGDGPFVKRNKILVFQMEDRKMETNLMSQTTQMGGADPQAECRQPRNPNPNQWVTLTRQLLSSTYPPRNPR